MNPNRKIKGDGSFWVLWALGCAGAWVVLAAGYCFGPARPPTQPITPQGQNIQAWEKAFREAQR